MPAFALCAFVAPNDIMLGGSNGIALALRHQAVYYIVAADVTDVNGRGDTLDRGNRP